VSADNKNGDRTIFIKCKCQGEGMSVEYDKEDNLYYFSYWSYGLSVEKLSWKQRLRYCWEVFRKGKPFNDELIFGQDQTSELIDFLLGYKRIPQDKIDKFVSILQKHVKRKKMKEKKVIQSKEKKACCKKNECDKKECKPKSDNGKGDAPRNNQSDKFRNNFDNINWSGG